MRTWRALGVLSTGIFCPCHVLVGIAGLIAGGAILSPEAQDGIHAVYVPFAVLVGALMLRRRAPRSTSPQRDAG
ncbi:MAG: hypothetical protein JOZ87_29850 [Chloroflexi bacterium]|nr:hypothetical protein [Chloroflexota bacterium]